MGAPKLLVSGQRWALDNTAFFVCLCAQQAVTIFLVCFQYGRRHRVLCFLSSGKVFGSAFGLYAIFICLISLFTSQSTIVQLYRDRSSWVEPVLYKDKCVLLKDTK